MSSVKKARWYTGLLAGALASLGGCGVSQELYNLRALELDRCRAELTRAQGEAAAARGGRDDLDRRLNELSRERDQLMDERLRLREELAKQKDIKATQQELDELRRQHELAYRRYEAFALLKERLEPLVSGKTLTVERPGNKKVVIRIHDELLFEPDKAELKTSGLWALKQVAAALKQVLDRSFLVAAHSDNVPVRVAPFRSKWELTAARAVAVVRFFQAEGVDPRQLAAAGYSEFDPLFDNDTPEHRAQNRRVEVVVLPRADELPSVEPPPTPEMPPPPSPPPAPMPEVPPPPMPLPDAPAPQP